MADNTASLVVALSAQLTKFENDMKRAGIMAGNAVDDIEKKFAGMNPQVNASFLGNLFSNIVTKGIETATKALTDFYDRFIALQGTARLTAQSLEQVWGFQEAAKASGATVDNATKSLEKLTFLLDEMQRGNKNSLSQLLDANPEAMRGINRETMTLAQTWQVLADIIRDFDKYVQKVQAARLAGMTDDMVPALEKGGAALKGIVGDASAAAPPLSKMVEQAKLFDEYMKSASQWIKADLAQGLQNTLREFAAIKAFFQNWNPFTLPGAGGGGGGGASPTEGLKRIKVGQSSTGSGTSRLPPPTAVDESTTALERQVDQIEKHILVTQASTAAVGLNVGEQERLKTEALLVAAAERDGVNATGEYAAALKLLASRAGDAALAQAKAADQFQKLNQASQIVGSAVSSAFADAIVEGKKLNEVVGSLIKTLEKAAINALVMNLFSPGGTGGVSPILKAIGFAGGTDFAPGGLAVVGERGPELVNLPRGSQVIPNNVARGMGGGGAITYAPMIDARGASVEAVARLAQIMEADRATFASRTVATIQSARRGRVPGL
jgi:hypothetical protein